MTIYQDSDGFPPDGHGYQPGDIVECPSGSIVPRWEYIGRGQWVPAGLVTSKTDPLTGRVEIPDGRAVVENTLAQGQYADQVFAPDDWTLTATGVVAAQRGYLSAVEIISGTGVTLTLRDSPDTAAGRQIWALPATNGPRRFEFPKHLPFHNGIHVTIGGATPVVKFILAGSE